MAFENASPHAVAAELGERLRQARLNANMTQAEVAENASISRKVVVQAEKGQVQLQYLIAIMLSLDLSSHLDAFLPKQEISPVQLMKLQGRKRIRASSARREEPKEKGEWYGRRWG